MKGIIVPSYYAWWTNEGVAGYNALVQAAMTMKKTTLYVVINPNSGPMGLEDGWLSKRIQFAENIRAHGHKVLYYISTQYGKRPSTEIISEMDLYKKVYRNLSDQTLVDGWFFDETNEDDRERLELLADEKEVSVFNLGVMPDQKYESEYKHINITFESDWKKLLGTLRKGHEAIIPYGFTASDWELLKSAADPAYMYVSPIEYEKGNLWGTLHPQFASLVRFVEDHADLPEPQPEPTTPVDPKHQEVFGKIRKAVELLSEVLALE